MTPRTSISTQITAIEALIGIANGRPKPTASQRDLVVSQARDAIASLNWIRAHMDKLKTAFGSDGGEGRT